MLPVPNTRGVPPSHLAVGVLSELSQANFSLRFSLRMCVLILCSIARKAATDGMFAQRFRFARGRYPESKNYNENMLSYKFRLTRRAPTTHRRYTVLYTSRRHDHRDAAGPTSAVRSAPRKLKRRLASAAGLVLCCGGAAEAACPMPQCCIGVEHAGPGPIFSALNPKMCKKGFELPISLPVKLADGQ